MPKLMYQVHLDSLVPQDNFYRKLDQVLDMGFLYKETAPYYGTEGQESIDPVVFFKMCLVGYLNNINSDRRLIEYCSNCLDVRLFISYDIDEPLPWHSTISRTRQLYGEGVFLSLFRKVLSLCVQKGMIRGKRQAIDSAFIKANASLDSLIEKEVIADAQVYCDELNDGSEFKLAISKKDEEHKPPSNGTHYSPTDPDARMSVKPGKATHLNFFGQIAVDDSHHVITGAIADFADKRDSQCLPNILGQTIENLKGDEILIDQIVADTGYSSGEAMRFCQANQIDAYIPNTGRYKPTREGFEYDAGNDRYLCTQGNKAILLFKTIIPDKNGHFRKEYRSNSSNCNTCTLKSVCIGKNNTKRITETLDKSFYDQMHEKMQTRYAKKLSKIRKSTVEPVLGTLINFLNMKRVNSRGIEQASKHVLMAALCYNLKKYMKYAQRKIKTVAMEQSIFPLIGGLKRLGICFCIDFKSFLILNRLRQNLIWQRTSNYRINMQSKINGRNPFLSNLNSHATGTLANGLKKAL
jgi:transposase